MTSTGSHDHTVKEREHCLLQALRLKGRVERDALTVAFGFDPEVLDETVTNALDAGYVTQSRAVIKLTPLGRERLAGLVQTERTKLDQDRLEQLYEAFHPFNDALKLLVTRWQIKDDGTPNDHTDEGYDADVISRLQVLHHGQFEQWLQDLVEMLPRLSHYPRRFANSIRELEAGNYAFVARPIIDSYHTVWFELHEELIGLLGRTRADEATAGRAV